MSKIFIVDDDKRIRDLINMYLKKEGYETVTFSNSQDALDSFPQEYPDLMVLDIMMQGMDGLDLCREIRKISEVPIIFVSARSEELDRILGLELGADDYIPKPFSPRELVARIKTVLKRTNSSKSPLVGEKTIKVKNFEIFLDRRIAKADNKELPLTIKEYDLLEYFMTNLYIPLSRNQIVEAIWGYNYDGYDRNVDDTVKRLRKKLKDAKADIEIKTIWGYGYRVDGDE